jgi:hypothetical protein
MLFVLFFPIIFQVLILTSSQVASSTRKKRERLLKVPQSICSKLLAVADQSMYIVGSLQCPSTYINSNKRSNFEPNAQFVMCLLQLDDYITFCADMKALTPWALAVRATKLIQKGDEIIAAYDLA